MLKPKLPDERKEYIIADYIELVCLYSEDSQILKEEANNAIYKRSTVKTTKEVKSYKDNEKKALQINECFTHLKYREKVFDKFYPFEIKDEQVVSVKKDLTELHKLYIFLLVCSSLSSLDRKETQNSFTSVFECISTDAINKYLPEFTVVRFGDSRKSFYDAIQDLAKQLDEDPRIESDYNVGNDGGLDIAAWKLLEQGTDKEKRGKLICFAQCTCTTQWQKKKGEPDIDRWRHYIDFLCEPVKFMFIPYCYRKSNGKWFDKPMVAGTILIDRLRICTLLHKDSSTGLKVLTLIDRIIKK
ncbi:MAG: hypothetical protein L3V56_12810 [Candidatus Magnetoovum sp. WYHC-5]|nr:hypothetical protein [Candidatus Magnetoovum sp. WYHC-5]